MHAVLTPLGRHRTSQRRSLPGQLCHVSEASWPSPFPHFLEKGGIGLCMDPKGAGGQTPESSDRVGLKIRKNLFFIMTVAEDKLWVLGDRLGAWSQI